MSRDDTAEYFGGLVDEFALIMQGADRTVKRYIHYRHELLWVHGVAAMLMGTLMFGTRKSSLVGPSTVFLRAIPGSPQSLAMLLLAGGFLLSIGLIFSWFNLKRVALLMLGLFYSLLSVSLAVPIFDWLINGAAAPALYSPILYLHLAVIMFVHVTGTFRARPKHGDRP